MNSEQLLAWCHAIQISSGRTGYQRKPLVMGILNVTPDSFSDGGRFMDIERASLYASEMIKNGADIIDIGGESSRPNADTLSLDEELSRVIPVIERIRAFSDIAISVDTYKPEVMQAAVFAGVSMINDIKALQADGALSMAQSLKVPVCLMHMQGVPKHMQDNPIYMNGVMDDIHLFFEQRIDACMQTGIPREYIIIDPGFGFGKSVRDNLTIVKQLNQFRRHHLPLLLGVSRKSTIGEVLQSTIDNRLMGGIAVALFAAEQNMAMVRTHDVYETYQALTMLDAIHTVK